MRLYEYKVKATKVNTKTGEKQCKEMLYISDKVIRRKCPMFAVDWCNDDERIDGKPVFKYVQSYENDEYKCGTIREEKDAIFIE